MKQNKHVQEAIKAAFIVAVILIATNVAAQTDTLQGSTSGGTFWSPIPPNYDVKHAIEVESLVPMFFTGGYHFAVGYRYEKFRIRFSVINGGSYDAEPAGLVNSSADFKRFYRTSPGVFLGYNVWKNLEIYTYLEFHTFGIEQKSTGIQQNIRSNDFGGGIAYQFFIGRVFYIQPGVHLYLRTPKGIDFNEVRYNIPTADASIVLRLGIRLWSSYE
jgi:hypothetical protein